MFCSNCGQAINNISNKKYKKRYIIISILILGALVLGILYVMMNKKIGTKDGTVLNNTAIEQGTVEVRPVATIKVKNYGTMKIELYYDEAPNTVKNFIALSNNYFYDHLTFHRIEKDFMIQGGDIKEDGTGNATLSCINKEIKEGTDNNKEYAIEGEFSNNGINNNIKFKKGVIAMARNDYSSYGLTVEGYNSASGQFFIMTEDAPSLDGEYAAFGKIIEGMEVLNEINNVEISPEDNKPIHTIVIESIRVDTKNKQYDLPETRDVFDMEKYLTELYHNENGNNEDDNSEYDDKQDIAEIKYNKINEGMSYNQVIGILGQPYSTSNTGAMQVCVWVINQKIITVQFMNDVVYQVLFNENNNNGSESNNDNQSNNTLDNKEKIYIDDIDISEMNENQIRKEFERKGLKVEIEKETRQVDFVRDKNEVGMIISSIISDTNKAYEKGDTIKVNILTYEAKPITINLQNVASCDYYGGTIKHCFLTENINGKGKRGANVYFNDKLIYSGNESFSCTYTKNETVHIKVVVPYLYECGNYDQENWQYTVGENYTKDVTVLDVTTTVEELVNGGELSVIFQREII